MEKQTKERVKEIQLVVFQVQGEEFGSPIHSVLEISRMLDITRIPEASGTIEGVVNLRGQVITVIDTARQLGFKRQTPLPKTGKIMIVEMQNEKMGLIVDEVPEVIRIPETEIEMVPELIQTKISKELIKGVAKIGERLIIVLDLERIGNGKQA